MRTSTDRTGCTNFFRKKMHFLRAGVDKRFDAYKAPHPAATGQVDVVGGFKVIAAVILAQFGAETDRRYAVAGVVLAPLLVNVVELFGADGVVRLEAEVALGFHEVDAVKSIIIFLQEKPDIVITTGVLAMIPLCLIAKLFGKKLIYIESFAKVSSPTETGRFLYKFADRFYVQWKPMLQFYPKAIYLGGIY